MFEQRGGTSQSPRSSRRTIAEADGGTTETAARTPHERERQVGAGEGLTRGELDGLLGGGLYGRLGHDEEGVRKERCFRRD